MALIAKAGKSFEPAPEGLHAAVCVDVVDLGELETPWGKKHKCRLVWEISETMTNGDRYIAGKQYTVSLHEKAALHKDLKSWRGKPFTADELAGFDIEKVIGAPCMLMIQHEEKDGTIYANIMAITKADKKRMLKPSGKYVRFQNRAENQKGREAGDDSDEYDNQEDDPIPDEIPF